MAEVIFDEADMARVDAVCAEFDPATDELLAAHLKRLDAGPRSGVVSYFRQALRAELIMGLLARAVADAAVRLDVASPEGARAMVEHDYDNRYTVLGLGQVDQRVSTWQHDFSVVNPRQSEAMWLCREDDTFPPSAFRAFYSLLDLAHDRMFPETVDDWAESLLPSD